MHSLKIITVLAFSTLLSSAVAHAGLPGSPLFPPAPAQAEPMFVVFNGVICFTAPCPSYTAVTEAGDVLELNGVQLPAKVKPELAAELNGAGLLVEGSVDFQGELVAQKVLKAGKTFTAFDNGIRCIKAPCPSVTTVTQAGAKKKVANIDFSALKLGAEEVGELEASLLRGDIVVHGFLVPGVEKSTTLLVLKVAAVTETFTVAKSGIVCVVAPCPSILATPENGAGIQVTDISTKALSLSATELEELFEAVFQDGLKVRGYIDHNQQTFGEGTVLHVTGLAQ